MTVEVSARVGGELLWSDWALNEAALEKDRRGRMVECVLEIEGRPLSRWACDGVVCATPTGSTAYAFSAGGPDRLARRRSAAHRPDQRPCALRPALGGGPARAPVASGDRAGYRRRRGDVRRPPHRRRCRTVLGVEVSVGRTPGQARPAASAVVHRSARRQVRPPGGRLAWQLAKCRTAAVVSYTCSMRYASAGSARSTEAVLELHSGLTVLSGETGAGKSSVVRAFGLLAGGRADVSTDQVGLRRAPLWKLGSRWRRMARLRRGCMKLGGELEGGSLLITRTVALDGRSRAFVGGRAVPVGLLAEIVGRLAGAARPEQPAAAEGGRGAAFAAGPVCRRRRSWGRWRSTGLLGSAGWPPAVSRRSSAPQEGERAREVELLRLGLAEVERVAPVAA